MAVEARSRAAAVDAAPTPFAQCAFMHQIGVSELRGAAACELSQQWALALLLALFGRRRYPAQDHDRDPTPSISTLGRMSIWATPRRRIAVLSPFDQPWAYSEPRCTSRGPAAQSDREEPS